MNYETALKIVEKYCKDHQFTPRYKAALAYFASNPLTIERLDPLLQAIILPGGISCEECKDLIPLVLAGIPLEPEKRAGFDRHLKECPDCSLEFADLQMMSQEN
jgi:hypothetical protein